MGQKFANAIKETSNSKIISVASLDKNKTKNFKDNYNLNELEIRVDEVESIDIENLKDEVNEVISNFENMTEGYTVSVKLNPPL